MKTVLVLLAACSLGICSHTYVYSSEVPNAPSDVYVDKGTNTLMVTQPNDIPRPYIVRGVTWSPATRAPDIGPNPLAPADPAQNVDYGFFFDWPGRTPQGHEILDYWMKNELLNRCARDLALMKLMNVNTVRIYENLGGDTAATKQLLDACYQNGIMVIMTVAATKQDFDLKSYETVVNACKDHPAILMWAIGNEWNLNLFYGSYGDKDSAPAMNAVTAAALRIKELDPHHPVCSVLGDLFDYPAGDRLIPLYVYRDKDSGLNRFVPSGWIGDYTDLLLDDQAGNQEAGRTCIKITYSAAGSRGYGWAGIYWQNPANNWGVIPGAGYDLTGAVKLTFWAKGENGGEQIDVFKMGGIIGPYPDSDTAGIGPVTLTNQWQKYEIDLRGKNLSYVIGGFCFSLRAPAKTFYLDEIRYELPSVWDGKIADIIGTCQDVDVWGINVYRGNSFYTLFDQWNGAWQSLAQPAKPLFISEFGVDSFRSNQNYTVNLGEYNQARADNVTGVEDEQMQADIDAQLWNELRGHLSIIAPGEMCLGGLVHEFNDELWKVGDYNVGLGDLVDYNDPADKHSYDHYNTEGFVVPGGSPDNVFNEEYFGLTKVVFDQNGVATDERAPKRAYTVLANLFKPDLVVTDIQFYKPGTDVPAVPSVGQLVTCKAILKNQGSSSTGTFSVKWFVDGKQVSYGSHVDLLPGQSSNGNVRFDWMPTQGTHSLQFVADSDAQVPESNETNNSFSRTVTLGAIQKPDLAVTDIRFYQPGTQKQITPRAGQLVTCYATLTNKGKGAAGAFMVKWFVDGKQVSYGSHAGLLPGQTSNGNVRYDWMPAQGTHSLKFVADSDAQIQESNESNNSYTQRVTVRPALTVKVKAITTRRR